MRMKAKRISLVVCLFLFLFVVIGKCVAPQSGRSFSCSGYRHAVADLRFQSALSRNNCERTNRAILTRCCSRRWPRSRARRSFC